MSKFTSKDLMNAMGLKVGDMFVVKDNDAFNEDVGISYIWEVVHEKVYHDKIMCKSVMCTYNLVDFIDEELKLLPRYALTEDEKAIVRNIPSYYKWIVRNGKCDNLRLFCEEPQKSISVDVWISDCFEWQLGIFNEMFKFIQWTDNNPVSIDELRKCL